MFVISVKFGKVVCYNRENILLKDAKPNQVCYFVRYSRVFVITVIVITEFDCIFTFFVNLLRWWWWVCESISLYNIVLCCQKSLNVKTESRTFREIDMIVELKCNWFMLLIACLMVFWFHITWLQLLKFFKQFINLITIIL